MHLQNVLTLRRTITAANGSSKWECNRSPSSQKEIRGKLRALGIDVDNLCSFMPQDRVGEFSRYKPKELLQNTLKTISYHDPSSTSLSTAETRTLYDVQMDLAKEEKMKLDSDQELLSRRRELERFTRDRDVGFSRSCDAIVSSMLCVAGTAAGISTP